MPKILLLSALFLVAFVPTGSSASSSSSVVVGEVFAGGGNTGAPYANDYVELFNRGSAATDVTGWTVQYASAASTSWSATPLSGTIPAGGHYLVSLASSGTVGAALPTADATGTTNLANTGGKVAVVAGGTSLTCGATAGSCATDSTIRDLVSYGSATDQEGGAPAPALTSTTALARDSGGCTDTGDNAADFAAGAPAPRNAASPATACAGTGGGTTGTVVVDLDLQSVLSLAVDRTSVSFGAVLPGTTPTPKPVAVTVVSSDPAGYTLTVRRSTFTPADLPLAISTGGSLVAIPTAADLTLATTTAATTATGDVRSTTLGFTSPLASLAAAHYTSTVTFTVIGR